jgi:hypothetical protein
MLSLALFLMLGPSSPAEAALTDVSSNPGIYAELKEQAARFFAAVLRRDIDTVVGFAVPEHRGPIRASLGAPNSNLSRILYTGRHSVKARLQLAKQSTLVLLKHDGLESHGFGTTACLIDSRLEQNWRPVVVGDLPPPDATEAMFCVFFFRDDNRWYASFGFAE